MIHIFFLKTCRAPTLTSKTSFKHVLPENLSFGGRRSKEASFHGSSIFPNGLGSKIQVIQDLKM